MQPSGMEITDMSTQPDNPLLQPPVARAAYSDRTSWLMAAMSRLAYERFEAPESRLAPIVDEIAELTNADQIAEAVDRYVQARQTPNDVHLEQLKEGLSTLGFELVETFSNAGTQAFLATRSPDRLAVLAFRGTEKDWRDIKADLNARFYNGPGGARIHTGFRKAYHQVRDAVRPHVEQLSEAGYQLYITGHSLGGALAIVATRDLNRDNIAACYTFGSPKVGNEEFGYSIKPPIYRVVNAVDAVPRVPPTWITEGLYQIARLVRIPLLRRFVANFRGYAHWGDMRYLTAGKPDDYSNVHLIPNLGLPLRIARFIPRFISDWKTPFKDHSIDVYCDKLQVYARSRLNEE